MLPPSQTMESNDGTKTKYSDDDKQVTHHDMTSESPVAEATPGICSARNFLSAFPA